MDLTDRKIIAILQSEGRITFTDLAERVRLSVSRCQRRVRELETSGVIRGYRAAVDAAALGYGFEVLVFATLTRPDAVTEFDAALADVPEVVEAQRLFGEPDYLIRVVSADLPSYQQLYESVLVRLPGVRGLNSTIVMKQAVPPRPLPGRPPRAATARNSPA
ncbi:Lrp/AsnC family transcriptional regulator [Streptomyces griseiscabiei]|uniref:Lrp/AsnC family transcriptional regulator n=1 Tax=Streptomyces griseiscabiei TaxID=2993540 RepID=A0ABU4L5L3_9ACTN|nr:Lrp/AsnC family transcriptional regulator [Streptomyces griseiscabiei]MBZ3901892.1 Lrp/AsnC family transcriptional regulator [Streptomyces griseiscabiei]MDX2910908.1 Lrp/AsnC family transcriptional regulator [Streptomyces griseiscabiei]